MLSMALNFFSKKIFKFLDLLILMTQIDKFDIHANKCDKNNSGLHDDFNWKSKKLL